MAITRSKLATYDGKGGKPAYVAYQGRVYDVSNLFTNGSYGEYKAGTDITSQVDMNNDFDFLDSHGIIVGGISDE